MGSTFLVVGALLNLLPVPNYGSISPQVLQKNADISPIPKQIDREGFPLPQGAVARLGSLSFCHEGVSGFVFLDGGRTLLSAGTDRVLRYWNAESGRPLRNVKIPDSANDHGWPLVVLAPSAKIAAALDLGTGVIVFDAQSGKEIKAVSADRTSSVSFMSFSPDENILAVGYSNMCATLFFWKDGSTRKLSFPSLRIPYVDYKFDNGTFRGHFSPDSKWFLAEGGSEPLCLFEVASGKRFREFSHTTASAFSPDSKSLAIAFSQHDGQQKSPALRICTVPKGEQVNLFEAGPFDSLAYSPDGVRLACARQNETTILSASDGKTIQKIQVGGPSLAYSPDGKYLASRSNQHLRVCNASTGLPVIAETTAFGSGRDPVLAISKDERFLAAADWIDRSIRLWDLKDLQASRVFLVPEKRSERLSVCHLSFSADHKELRAGLYEGGVETWDLKSGTRQKPVEFSEPFNPPYYLHVSADGKRVSSRTIIGGQPPFGTSLVRWDSATGHPVGHQTLSPSRVEHHAWLEDGALFLASGPSELQLSEVATGKSRWKVNFNWNAKQLAVSPDERLLAVSKTMKHRGTAVSVEIIEAANGRTVCELETGPVEQMCFLADNRSLVTSGAGLLQSWDLSTRRVQISWPLSWQIPEGKEVIKVNALFSYSSSPRLLSVQADGSGLIWDFSTKPRANNSDK